MELSLLFASLSEGLSRWANCSASYSLRSWSTSTKSSSSSFILILAPSWGFCSFDSSWDSSTTSATTSASTSASIFSFDSICSFSCSTAGASRSSFAISLPCSERERSEWSPSYFLWTYSLIGVSSEALSIDSSTYLLETRLLNSDESSTIP